MDVILRTMQAIQLNLFTGERLPLEQSNYEVVEDSYFSKEIEDCCFRCQLKGSCDYDYCAKNPYGCKY